MFYIVMVGNMFTVSNSPLAIPVCKDSLPIHYIIEGRLKAADLSLLIGLPLTPLPQIPAVLISAVDGGNNEEWEIPEVWNINITYIYIYIYAWKSSGKVGFLSFCTMVQFQTGRYRSLK